MRTHFPGRLLLAIILVVLMIGAPIAGGAQITADEPAASDQPSTTSIPDNEFIEFENVKVWERAGLPLRADKSQAADKVVNHQVLVQRKGKSSGEEINRQELAIYEEGQITVEFTDTPNEVDEFANEDAEVIVGYLDEDTTEEEIEELPFGIADVPESIGGIEEFLTEENRTRVNDNVTFVEKTGKTFDSDGTLDITVDTEKSVYDPGTGHYMVMVTNNTDVFTVDNENDLDRDATDPDGAIVGVEGFMIRQDESDVINPNEARAGNAIDFTVNTGLSGSDVGQAIALYNTSNFTDTQTKFELEKEVDKDLSSDDVIVNHEIEEINGESEFDGDVDFAGVTINDRTTSGTTALSDIVSFAADEISVSEPDTQLFEGSTAIDGQAILHASAKGKENFGPSGTLTVETFENFSTGEYRYVHVASESDTSQAFETATGTLTLTRELDVTVQDTNNNPISGAEVTIDGTTKQTNDNGDTPPFNLVDGTYDISVSASGFEDQTFEDITIDGANPAQNLQLSSSGGGGGGGIGGAPLPPTGGGGTDDGDSGGNEVIVPSQPKDENTQIITPGQAVTAGTNVSATLQSTSADEESGVTFNNLNFTTTAFVSDVNVTATRSNERPDEASEDVPTEAGGLTYLQLDYSETVKQSVSNVNFRVTIQKSRLDLDSRSLNDVVLYRYEEGQWNELETRLLKEGESTATFRVDSPGLSVYAVTFQSADISIASAELNTTEADVGQPVGVPFTLENQGSGSGDVTVELLVDGETVGTSKELTVEGNSETSDSFSYTFEESGEYEVAVQLDDSSTSAGTVTVAGAGGGGGTGTTTIIAALLFIVLLVVVGYFVYSEFMTGGGSGGAGGGGSGGAGGDTDGFGSDGTAGGAGAVGGVDTDDDSAAETDDDFGTTDETEDGDEDGFGAGDEADESDDDDDDGFGSSDEADTDDASTDAAAGGTGAGAASQTDEGTGDEPGDSSGTEAAGTDQKAADDTAAGGTGAVAGGTTKARADETEAEPEAAVGAADETAASQAQFELFEDNGGKYRWRLRHTNGNVIADSGQGYASEPGVNQAAKRVSEVAAAADTLEYDPAGFELHEEADGEWYWRLRHKNGSLLAESASGYSSRSNARQGIDRARSRAETEENFQGYTEDDAFRWRLVGENGQAIAESGRSYSREDSAREAIGRMKAYAPEADTLEYDPAAYELFLGNDDKWRWRLRTMNGNVIADSGQGYSSKQKAKQGMQSVMNNAPDAAIGSVDG